jgi:uncharacterized protein YhjY with autotransporter beta-barrel domain/Zn-dependent M28 family amino/carboxypeptidase
MLAIAAASLTFATSTSAYEYGRYASDTLDTLINDYPGRYRGTASFEGASNWMDARLAQGYSTSRQNFSWTAGGQTRSSQNVIAQATGVTGQSLVVGAHFDTYFGRPTLQGLDDNGSGAAVLTEIARNLSGLDFEDGVTFIGFGAEEEGLRGSRAYVASLDPAAHAALTGMINIDSLITGDRMYAHAGTNSVANPALASLRNRTFEIAQELGIELYTNPGLDASYPAGTGCCSDGDSFNPLGIPVAYFESTNWSIGALDGYDQTTNPAIPGGATWHNPALDNEQVLTAALGENRIAERLRDYSRLLTRLVLEATNTDLRYSAFSGAATQRALQNTLRTQEQMLGALHDRRWMSLLASSRDVGSYDGMIGAEGGAQPSSGFDEGAHGRGRRGSLYALGDYQLTPAVNIGTSVSYQHGKDDLQSGGEIKADTFQVGIYAQYADGGPVWANTDATLGYSDMELDRRLRIQGSGGPVLLDQRFKADPNGWYWGLRAQSGYDFALGALRTGPMIGLAYRQYRMDSYNESGPQRTALRVEKETFDSLEVSAGWQLRGVLPVGNGRLLQPYASLAWVEELGDGYSDRFDAVSRADGTVRRATLDSVDKHFARARVGAQLMFNANFGVYAEGSGRLGNDDGSEAAYNLGVQWVF